MEGWVRCICALTGNIGVLSWCQDQRLPPTYLQDFFLGPRGPPKDSSIPRPSFLPPVHHSAAIFSFSKILYSFPFASPNILQIFSPPQKIANWCYIHPAAQMPSLGTLQKPQLQLRTKNMQQQANVTIVGRMSMIANVVPDPSKYALKCEQSSALCDITWTLLVNN